MTSTLSSGPAKSSGHIYPLTRKEHLLFWTNGNIFWEFSYSWTLCSPPVEFPQNFKCKLFLGIKMEKKKNTDILFVSCIDFYPSAFWLVLSFCLFFHFLHSVRCFLPPPQDGSVCRVNIGKIPDAGGAKLRRSAEEKKAAASWIRWSLYANISAVLLEF